LALQPSLHISAYRLIRSATVDNGFAVKGIAAALGVRNAINGFHILGRYGRAGDMADAILFPAADAAARISGVMASR
jgi:hypothetical protein